MKADTSVVVMDRHALVRAGLRQHFEQLHGLAVTADFAGPTDLLHHLHQHAVDVVVLDCFQREHAMSAEVLLGEIRARSGASIVVFSIEGSSAAAAMCVQAGAHAFVDKRERVTILASTVRSVAEMAPPRCADQDVGFLAAGLGMLTGPETDVIKLVASGMGTVQISNTLGKARSTVSAHKWNALAKLQVRSELEFLKILPQGFQWPRSD
ncbi:response regulator transcription factor [Stenotrophomonas sp. PS02301]|uniref:response regulator transcription factor n=1 Tax=Stenotrophomonas sp. PS02301 TaxID=2991427 RepID=UPI00249B0840|nr:response regulator transcription factor [Stenotrophomonas sp. PS02301]